MAQAVSCNKFIPIAGFDYYHIVPEAAVSTCLSSNGLNGIESRLSSLNRVRILHMQQSWYPCAWWMVSRQYCSRFGLQISKTIAVKSGEFENNEYYLPLIYLIFFLNHYQDLIILFRAAFLGARKTTRMRALCTRKCGSARRR